MLIQRRPDALVDHVGNENAVATAAVAIDVTARVPDALLGQLRKRSGIDSLEVV